MEVCHPVPRAGHCGGPPVRVGTSSSWWSAHVEAGDYRGKWDHDLGVPTRIAWGMADRTLPYKTCTGWFREALPDAEWVELPDCGHLSQHDDPELVARTILDVTTARAPEVQPQLG